MFNFLGVFLNESVIDPEFSMNKMLAYVNADRSCPGIQSDTHLQSMMVFNKNDIALAGLLHCKISGSARDGDYGKQLTHFGIEHQLDYTVLEYINAVLCCACDDSYLLGEFWSRYRSKNRETLHPGILWLLAKACEEKKEIELARVYYQLSAEKGFRLLYEDVARLEKSKKKQLAAIKKVAVYAKEVNLKQKFSDLEAMTQFLRPIKRVYLQCENSVSTVDDSHDDDHSSESGYSSNDELLEECEKVRFAGHDLKPVYCKAALTSFELSVDKLMNKRDVVASQQAMDLTHANYLLAQEGRSPLLSRGLVLAKIRAKDTWRLRTLANMMREGCMDVDVDSLTPLMYAVPVGNDETGVRFLDVDTSSRLSATISLLNLTSQLIAENLVSLFPETTKEVWLGDPAAALDKTLSDGFEHDPELKIITGTLCAQLGHVLKDRSYVAVDRGESAAPMMAKSSRDHYEVAEISPARQNRGRHPTGKKKRKGGKRR